MGYGGKRYASKVKPNTTFGLNITSMTDMFTILLVFLLQTYSTNEVQIIPEKDLRLPVANAEGSLVESVKLSVSATELKIDGKVIASLVNSDFTKADVDSKDSNFITPLFNALQAFNQDIQEKRKTASLDPKVKIKKAYLDPETDGRVLLMADEALSYQVLRKVMYTASMAGFPKLKLATVVGN